MWREFMGRTYTYRMAMGILGSTIGARRDRESGTRRELSCGRWED